MRLGAFMWGVGHHLAAWRHPDADPSLVTDWRHYVRLAQLAERGTFDAIFFADNVGIPASRPKILARNQLVYCFDPVVLLSAIAPQTEKIGLISTVSTSYLPPYHLARKFASLDIISGGRTGWNLVTSGSDFEAQNFGQDHQTPHDVRYRRAREYVEVVKGLWDSWDDDAFVYDKGGGDFFDPAALHPLDHRGEFYSVRGPLQTGRPVQGHPVIVQAGSSEDGQDLAAATAEVVFTAQQSLASAQAFYRGLKARVAKAGRGENEVLVMPGVMPIIGRSEAEANARYEALQALIDPAIGVGLLSGFLGFDLTGYPVDGPLPPMPVTEGWRSRQEMFAEMARREGLSIRQLYERVSGARGHKVMIGTATSIAEELEAWFTGGAADGFNILPATLPGGLVDVVDELVPELRRRGLFRTDYEGATLREHLGLARPSARRRATTPAGAGTA
jgi:FMN-dependent oxidoreductase (nitrilotriacetate monooxygenase family)